MDRIIQMKRKQICTRTIFRELGKVQWSQTHDAFAVRTELGATLLLSPNCDEGLPTGVRIDEIEVPEPRRRRGVATNAMAALCELADQYQFRLEGGPVGWSDDPWREKFVEWLKGFGFAADPRFTSTPIDDPSAFLVRRLPKRRHVTQ